MTMVTLRTRHPHSCSPPPAKFRRKILEAQRLVFRAAGVPLDGPDAFAEERLIELPDTGCSLNAVVAPPPRPDAPALVAVHGWGGGLAAYSFGLRELAQHFAVYLIDLPGMGASDRCAFPTDTPDAGIDYFLKHLQGAYDKLLVSDAVFRSASSRHLVGHSLGGYLSVLWSLDRPQAFSSLFLASPVGVPERPPSGQAVPTGLPAVPMWKRAIWAVFRIGWAAGIAPQTFLRVLPEAPARAYMRRSAMRRYDGILPPHMIAHFSAYMTYVSRAPPTSEAAFATVLAPGAWARRPLAPRLAEVAVPVCFSYGDRDWMDRRAAETAVDGMEFGSKVVVVPRADHNLHVMNSEKFVECAVEWACGRGRAGYVSSS